MKHLVLFLLLFLTVTGFAQEAVESAEALDPSFSALKEFFLPAILAGLSVLWMDTMKHLKGGNYNIGIALKTKLVPFLLSTGLAVGCYYLISYLPFTKDFIEIAIEADLSEVTAIGLMTPISILIDNLYKTYIEKVPEE